MLCNFSAFIALIIELSVFRSLFIGGLLGECVEPFVIYQENVLCVFGPAEAFEGVSGLPGFRYGEACFAAFEVIHSAVIHSGSLLFGGRELFRRGEFYTQSRFAEHGNAVNNAERSDKQSVLFSCRVSECERCTSDGGKRLPALGLFIVQAYGIVLCACGLAPAYGNVVSFEADLFKLRVLRQRDYREHIGCAVFDIL